MGIKTEKEYQFSTVSVFKGCKNAFMFLLGAIIGVLFMVVVASSVCNIFYDRQVARELLLGKVITLGYDVKDVVVFCRKFDYTVIDFVNATGVRNDYRCWRGWKYLESDFVT